MGASPRSFRIDGRRLSLPPDDVYSVYPPPGGPSGHVGTLPNVVLARATLPWERRLDGGVQSDATAEPWLGLIVLSERDFGGASAPSPTPGVAGELAQPPSGVRGPQGLVLDGTETAGSPCRWIDLDWELALSVLPRRDELPLLAHVRSVRTDHKETWSRLTDGTFAVLCANRLPPAAEAPASECETLCLLVSWEGHAQVLERTAPKADRLRLAVLGEWRYATDQGDPFAAAMEALDPQRGQDALLRPPVPTALARTASGQGEAAKAAGIVQDTAGRGYALLRHRTRVGAETASWYRGPLLPRPMPPDIDVIDMPTVDTLLSFDPDTGMMDTSYAAAWQLGRLLTLRNSAVATAIRRYRRNVGAALRADQERVEIRERMHFNKVLVEAATLDRAAVPSAPTTPPSQLELAEKLFGASLTAAPALSGDQGHHRIQLPPEIPAWVARLALLYSVPPDYLVPAASALPPESIRFFHLDRIWVAALLTGALSVGKPSAGETNVDHAFRLQLVEKAPALAAGLRDGDDGVPDTDAPAFNHWIVTGFLLRSRAVEAWLGLEAMAQGMRPDNKSNNKPGPLRPLRIDRLGPDLLLCLFEGELDHLSVRQPPEGVHFGCRQETGDLYHKSVRPPPRQTRDGDDLPSFEVPFREGGAVGVLDVDALAERIGSILKSDYGASDSARPSAALFAHFMVETPVRIDFTAPGWTP